MSVIDRTELSAARARASRIRQGIHNYLETLAEISAAYEARDWTTLGYEDWASYVDEEFGADRLRLPAEHRQKAIQELRLAGMSQRAIATVIGVSQKTVDRALDSGESNDSPDTVLGADGKRYASSPPAQPEPALSGEVIPPALADAAARDAIAEHEREQADREALRGLANELGLRPDPAADARRDAATAVLYPLFDAITVIAHMPPPGAVIEQVEPYQQYRLDELPTALAWIEAFAEVWKDRA